MSTTTKLVRTRRHKSCCAKRYKKRTRTRTRTRTHKKKFIGGTCYGKGVGANNYDPNYSIYNTRELSLFPYNPR